MWIFLSAHNFVNARIARDSRMAVGSLTRATCKKLTEKAWPLPKILETQWPTLRIFQSQRLGHCMLLCRDCGLDWKFPSRADGEYEPKHGLELTLGFTAVGCSFKNSRVLCLGEYFQGHVYVLTRVRIKKIFYVDIVFSTGRQIFFAGGLILYWDSTWTIACVTAADSLI